VRATERNIIVAVAVLGLAIAFYLLALGPKRDESSKLQDQINQLHGSITAAQQQASYGEQARQDFPKYYGRMVVLGKAVPAQSDTASLLVQLSSLTRESGTKFQAITLNPGGSSDSSSSAGSTATPSASSPAQAGATASTASSTASGTSTASSTPAATTPTPTAAPATESSAAALPIGSVVGTAGLPTLPYALGLRGNYFDIANFIGKVDGLVSPVADGGRLSPNGRLLTLNGFALQIVGTGSSPKLKGNFVVTAYSSGDQGLTAGATSAGPAPTSPGETQVQPASAVVAK
jgi:Tfp pilus assembly protein PilO